jgi:hypothetical protein
MHARIQPRAFGEVVEQSDTTARTFSQWPVLPVSWLFVDQKQVKTRAVELRFRDTGCFWLLREKKSSLYSPYDATPPLPFQSEERNTTRP